MFFGLFGKKKKKEVKKITPGYVSQSVYRGRNDTNDPLLAIYASSVNANTDLTTNVTQQTDFGGGNGGGGGASGSWDIPVSSSHHDYSASHSSHSDSSSSSHSSYSDSSYSSSDSSSSSDSGGGGGD